MISREKVAAYITDNFGANQEFVFEKFPSFGTFHHPVSGKWFALLMELPENKLQGQNTELVSVLNVKIKPEIGEILRNKRGIYPAYHMNKQHWVSLNLAQLTDFMEVCQLIEDSFYLTR